VPLTYGASGLPSGGSYTDVIEYAVFGPQTITWTIGGPPIPAGGTSNGTGPFTTGTSSTAPVGYAYVVTKIPAGLAANSTVDVTFWASDGTTKQTEVVPIQIKSSCARRY
jgi:hypothetical protein